MWPPAFLRRVGPPPHALLTPSYSRGAPPPLARAAGAALERRLSRSEDPRKIIRPSSRARKIAGRISDCRGLGLAEHAELPANPILDRLVDLRVLLEELLGVLAALPEPLAAVREPRARLLHDPLVDRQVQQIAGLRDALAVHHVELRLAERR